MQPVLHVMLNVGNSMDEDCIDAITVSNQITSILRKVLSCCEIWEREGKGIDPLV